MLASRALRTRMTRTGMWDVVSVWPGGRSRTPSRIRRSCSRRCCSPSSSSPRSPGLSQLNEIPGFDFGPVARRSVRLRAAPVGRLQRRLHEFGLAQDFEGGFAKRLLLAARASRRDRPRLCARRDVSLARRRRHPHRRRARRGYERRRRRGRPLRSLRPRVARQLLRLLLGRRIAMRFRTIQAAPLMQMRSSSSSSSRRSTSRSTSCKGGSQASRPSTP